MPAAKKRRPVIAVKQLVVDWILGFLVALVVAGGALVAIAAYFAGSIADVFAEDGQYSIDAAVEYPFLLVTDVALVAVAAAAAATVEAIEPPVAEPPVAAVDCGAVVAEPAAVPLLALLLVAAVGGARGLPVVAAAVVAADIG